MRSRPTNLDANISNSPTVTRLWYTLTFSFSGSGEPINAELCNLSLRLVRVNNETTMYRKAFASKLNNIPQSKRLTVKSVQCSLGVITHSKKLELASPASQPNWENKVMNQIEKPTANPAYTPRRFPKRQYIPPNSAGANCPTAAKDK